MEEISVDPNLIMQELLEANQGLQLRLAIEAAKVKQLTSYINKMAEQLNQPAEPQLKEPFVPEPPLEPTS